MENKENSNTDQKVYDFVKYYKDFQASELIILLLNFDKETKIIIIIFFPRERKISMENSLI